VIDTVSAAVPHRQEIPEEFTWDLTTMYADDHDWEEDLARIEAMIPEVEMAQGTTGQNAEALLRVLEMKDRVSMQMSRLYVYARMRKDVDGTDPSGHALDTRAASLSARISAALSFIEPEILAIPPEKLARWQTESPELAPYAYYLDLLSRQRNHVRSTEVESVIAQFSDITRASGDTYDILTNADLVFPTIEDEHGQTIQLSQGRYGSLLESPDRRVRRETYQGVLGTFAGVRRTLATTLAAAARDDALSAHLHNYPSALTAALAPNDIPVPPPSLRQPAQTHPGPGCCTRLRPASATGTGCPRFIRLRRGHRHGTRGFHAHGAGVWRGRAPGVGQPLGGRV